MPFEIIPHLWLGNRADAKHVVHESIKCVVNCTRDIPFYATNTSNIRIAVDDIDDDNDAMVKVWTETDVFNVMLEHIRHEQDVLVHCLMGRQRSAATIAAFMMKHLDNNSKYRLTKDDAINYIKSKKMEAFFPDVNFDKALTQY
jgi:predicted protein tyrosine phosphatase